MQSQIPNSMQPSFERSVHPFHMWDGITSIPNELSAILRPEAREVVKQVAEAMKKANVVHLLGCGTSFFSAMSGVYAFNEIADILAQAHNAFEFANYKKPMIGQGSVVAISHTGETSSVLDAVSYAADQGAVTVGLTDIPNSPLCRLADHILLGDAGREPSMPKTRSYVASLLKHYLLATEIGNLKGYDVSSFSKELDNSPNKAEEMLSTSQTLTKHLAETFKRKSRIFIVGNGPNIATAFEGALKLQETDQILAHALELEEGMHGPWVTIEPGDLVIVLAVRGPGLAKAKGFISALRSINVETWVITDETDGIPYAQYESFLPKGAPEYFTPLYSILPLYQFVYYLALARGIKPDSMRLTDKRYLDVRLKLPR